MRRWSFAAALLAATAPAHADWRGKGETGLVLASGNTDTQTANAKLEAITETSDWKLALGGAALYASDEEGKTANRWNVFSQLDWSFTKRNFLFGAGRYEEDEFSGFQYQAAASYGFGRRFFDAPATKATGTIGAGYKFFETRDSFDEVTGALIEEGESNREVIVRATLDFDHEFTPTTNLINRLIVESGADNTFVSNDLSLQVKMNEVLALAVGFAVRHNTQPPQDFQETDTLTTINLVYEVK